MYVLDPSCSVWYIASPLCCYSRLSLGFPRFIHELLSINCYLKLTLRLVTIPYTQWLSDSEVEDEDRYTEFNQDQCDDYVQSFESTPVQDGSQYCTITILIQEQLQGLSSKQEKFETFQSHCEQMVKDLEKKELRNALLLHPAVTAYLPETNARWL